MAKVYYFGCRNGDGGHYLWNYEWNRVDYKLQREFRPWNIGEIDFKLCPRYGAQGIVKVHHKDGWSALAFEDFTVDDRPGSNSCFLIDKIVDFKEGIELAQASWPQLFKRFEEAGLELKEYEGT